MKIKKRRKRNHLAVDPCLGFYPEISCSPAPTHVTYAQATTATVPPSSAQGIPSSEASTNVEAADAPVSPTQIHAPAEIGLTGASDGEVALDSDTRIDSPPGASIEAITVETFSRRAASPTKHYGHQRARKRKRAKRAQPNSQDTYRPSSDPHDSDHELPSSEPPRKRSSKDISWTSDEDEDAPIPKRPAKRRRRPLKKVQSLAARLLIAGAATGVDMVGGPLLPTSKAHISTRRPIPLVPNHRLPSPPPDSKDMRRHFVDPRTAPLLCRASFQFGASATDVSSMPGKRGARPVTAWKPGGHEASSHRDNKPCKPVLTRTERLVTVPLVLAPAVRGVVKDTRR
ncbi:hypothetical protein TRAPUB_6055 [Trametes pubescens]|uniref:Uncharacterized protein n=1 Tax=Trametes pubescens TaxID=154538 RepID=A0A1M2V7B3_TRAPU|nr:hypothetical protein TRAPUB_6055 [Trametes pubescens]